MVVLCIIVGILFVAIVGYGIILFKMHNKVNEKLAEIDSKVGTLNKKETANQQTHNEFLCRTQGHMLPNSLDGNNGPKICRRCGKSVWIR